MSNDTVVSLAAPAPVPDPLTELLRSGARRLVEAAVRAEFEEHLSAFATIRHRSSRAKGCVTRKTMLSMVYKMGRCAEKSWRRLRGFRHLAKVIEGVRFNDGIEVIEDRRAAA